MSIRSDAMRALDIQLGLINYYKSEEGVKFTQNFMTDQFLAADDPEIQMMLGDDRNKAIYERYSESDELVMQAKSSGSHLSLSLAKAMNEAQTFYLTDDMMSLNLTAGSNVPLTPFTPDDLPCEHGFVLLPRVLRTADIHDMVMTARAFAWMSMPIRHITPLHPDGYVVPSLVLVYFCSKHDWREDSYLTKEREETPEYFLSMPDYQMTHWQPIGFGEEWRRYENESPHSSPEVDEASQKTMVEWSAFMKSFFLLVKQKIAVIQHQHPDRGHMRRLARSALMPESGDIQIVTLRKERPTSPDEITDGTPVEWSHRWLVTGHWHPYWVGSGSEKRLEPRWVETYEKGPENKPLVIKDKVFVWKR